jgi:N-hydroxyarylamine O-acetyltransferase
MDLEAYLARSEYSGTPHADLATLAALHLAHASAIPFENLDVRLGLPISLELGDIEDKLVRRRRGGYCFEHNTLFLAVLRALGFDAVPFEARVRFGTTEVRPRTHMLLCVRIGGQSQLVDVGFGWQGLLGPLPMDGTIHEQFGESYRVVAEAGQFVLQMLEPQGWADLYAFVAEERFPVDFLMANHFTSTYPRSPFVQTLNIQLSTATARHRLRDLTYTVTRDGRTEERTLDPNELRAHLRDVFGLDVPEATIPALLPRQ